MFLNINLNTAIVLFGIVFVILNFQIRKPKIMKRNLLLFSLSIASLLCSSQTDKFDLSKYKLPDIKRQQLDVFFQSNGQNSSSKYFFEDKSDSLKNEDRQFNGEYSLRYSYYHNSPKIQSFISACNLGNYSKSKHDRTNYYLIDNKYFYNYLSFDYNLKYFFSPSNWFVATVPHYSLSYYNRNYNDENSDSKSIYTNASVGIGGGKGRIEQVQDFRHAVLLIEELEKRGVSARNISEAEMIELSTLISQLKNKRFFDSRKQKETELIALDSFFVNKGIVDEKSIQYFTGLEDIWSYGGLQVRESGKQVMFSIIPEYNIGKDLIKEENNTNEDLLINYHLSFVSKNPISIKWQGNYGFGLNHEYLKRLQQQNENLEEKSYQSHIFADGQIGYYPNTRTYFGLNSRITLSNRSDEKGFDNERYSAGLQVGTSAYYYISEKLRLGYNLHYNTSKYGIFNIDAEDANYNTFYYSITLNYAIF
jgi:hypothetical protein